LLDLLRDDTEKAMLSKIVFKATVSFSDLGCGGHGGVHRGVAGVQEGVKSHASAH
jgi:hypothetical protein